MDNFILMMHHNKQSISHNLTQYNSVLAVLLLRLTHMQYSLTNGDIHDPCIEKNQSPFLPLHLFVPHSEQVKIPTR